MTEPAQSAEAASEDQGAPSPKRMPLSRRRKWLFRMAAIGLSLFPLVALELVLRWCDVGHDTRLIIRDETSRAPNTFQFNPDADRAYYGVEDLWGPDLRPFQIPKPDDVYRIVVVGGSSVAGFPYPFELAMPRQMELVLNRQMPERKFEVLNAGMTAIMSLSEVDVVRQAVACQPDLIVLHTGHNEFYGPGGSASNFGAMAPGLYPLNQVLKRQRSFQLLLSLFPKPRKSHLIETLPADIDIPLDSDMYRAAEERFRENIERMMAIAAEADIPILLSTVPANLRNMAPLEPPKNEIVIRQLKEAAQHIKYEEYDSAMSLLVEAGEVDPRDPLVVYRKAQCLEGLGREQEAAAAYALALDLDGCRFRAPESFLRAVRAIGETAPERVHFCDVAAELKARSRLPAPGHDYFLEHVHYNFEGNWEVACIIGQTIVQDVLRGDWRPERVPDVSLRDELLGVTLLDHLAADSMMIIGLTAWPFNLSPARTEETQAMKERIAERYLALEPAERGIFAALPLDAMHQHLHLAMGEAWVGAGNVDRALAAFQRHLDRRPWETSAYERAAQVLKARGKLAEANEILRQAAVMPPPSE